MSNFFDHPAMLRVAIVDDSPLIRKMIETVIEETDGMHVVGMAADPYEARQMIKDVNPDILTLDIEMPKMNGIAFLEKIMTLRPMPVIMVSTLTQNGANATVQALEIGAVDYVAKPVKGSTGQDILGVFRNELIPKIKTASNARCKNMRQLTIAPRSNQKIQTQNDQYRVMAMASSTGGIERLRYLISRIEAHIPPLCVVQHINKIYTPNMVERLQKVAPSHIQVKLAENGEPLQNNTVYFADNLQHLQIIEKQGVLHTDLIDAPPLNGFVASADYLFNSLAGLSKPNSLGIILSGLGNDGADGLFNMQKSGCLTIGENKESCLVYGMPKAAMQLGALRTECRIDEIVNYINGKSL